MNRSSRDPSDRAAFRERYAREHELTPEEATVWSIAEEMGWKKQVPLELEGRGIILDFYHPKLKLALEIDGKHHKKTVDARRDRRLMKIHGIATIRWTNKEVNDDLPSIQAFLLKLLD